MHAAVLDWVARWAPASPCSVLDIGGRDVNGHPVPLFHDDTTWEVVDLVEGPRVTWVGDILDHPGPGPYDVALCLEVAEHTPAWPAIVTKAAELLDRTSGLFVLTAAGPGRAPHSAVDGGELRAGEHYANLDPSDLAGVLEDLFPQFVVDETPGDVRAAAWFGERP
jgi:hypothetical protein